MSARRLSFVILGAATVATPAYAQVPDLLNALDAGGRAMGMGGSLYPTSSDTLSSYYNPAGLGYISESTVGIAYRNLPRSRTTASGDFNDPTLDTSGTSGSREITHFGFVLPFAKGGLGLSYTVGGFIDDFRTGDITIGGDPVSNYAERIRAKTEFFTLAYGNASRDQTFSWGAGIQLVQASLADQLAGTVNGVPLSGTSPATTNGIAGIVGVQFNPRGSKMSWGVSYRSEVNLSDNDSTTFLMDKVPARLMGGVAFRQDGMRGGKDFLVYGAQISHFFSADNDSQNFMRQEQTTGGVGLEYNHDRGGARIPIRVGYNFAPSGGPGFGDRNAITFGIGYRPPSERFSIDLNFAKPQHGGFDLGLSLSYKLGSNK
jgi:hypothetical protein